MPSKTVPIFARVDIKKFVAIARWFDTNFPNLGVRRYKSRIIGESINLLHTLLEKQSSFEPIEDVEEALIILDNWGIGFTSDRARRAAADSIHFDERFDIRTLATTNSEEEAAVDERIRDLFRDEPNSKPNKEERE